MNKILVFLVVVYVASHPKILTNMNLNIKNINIQNNYNDIKQFFNQMVDYKDKAENTYEDAIEVIDYIKYKEDIFTDLYDNECQDLFKELSSLEKIYNDRMLKSYGIDPVVYHEVIDNIESKEEKEHIKKEFILQNGHLTEREYEEKFVSPFEKIKRPYLEDDMTISELRTLYKKYLREQIQYVRQLIKK